MIQLKRPERKKLFTEIWKSRYLYILILPVMAWLIIFHYRPLYGIVLAFKKYNAQRGILGSEWVGLKNFARIFITPEALSAMKNTFVISFSRLVLEFPAPIILALLITEMPGKRVKSIYQTILTFSHFLSWIVISAVLQNFLSGNGAVNSWIASMGGERINFLSDKALFRPMLYLTSNWKEMGWSAIIYMASIAGIDSSLYDAAKIDGASRLRQIWHVTLPSIRPTIAILFILQVGNCMNAGFDQIFTLRNPVVSSVGQILDTYVYDISFLSGKIDYGFSTAVGLFKSVINMVLLVAANKFTSVLTGDKMFG